MSQYASNLGNSSGAAGNASVGPTGSPAPVFATEIGFISAGNLTGVSAANPLPVTIDGDTVLANVNIADFGGTPVTIGQQLAAASMPVVLASNQPAIPVTQSTSPWVVSGTVAATQSGTWTVQPGNTPNTTPWLATINQGGNSATVTAANALKVDGSAVTQPISAATLPLPTGASTSALQSNVQSAPGTPQTVAITVQGNAAGVPIPVSGTVTASNPSVSATGAAPPASATYIGGSVTTAAPSYTTGQLNALSLNLSGGLRVDGSGVTQPVSGTVAATQSGIWTVQPGNTQNTTAWLVQDTSSTTSAVTAATRALQAAGVFNTTPTTLTNGQAGFLQLDSAENLLVNLKTALPAGANAIGSVTVTGTVATASPVNTNGTFTGSLSVTTTEASTAAPANAVGVVFEAESGNATNIRWGVSNSAGTILSTSSGVLMEPGRSIDFLPIGTGTFLHYISTAAGTNTIDIQWIKSS